MLKLARCYVKDEGDVEDLCQEALLYAWKVTERRGEWVIEYPWPFLKSVLKYRCCRYRSKMRRRQELAPTLSLGPIIEEIDHLGRGYTDEECSPSAEAGSFLKGGGEGGKAYPFGEGGSSAPSASDPYSVGFPATGAKLKGRSKDRVVFKSNVTPITAVLQRDTLTIFLDRVKEVCRANNITDKQRVRWECYAAWGMTMQEIADREGVKWQSVQHGVNRCQKVMRDNAEVFVDLL